MISIAWGSSICPDFRESICNFVRQELHGELGAPLNCVTALGVFEDTFLKGAVIYHDYDEEADVVEISGVNCLTRLLPAWVLRAIYEHAFEGLGCQLIIAKTDTNNKKACNFLRGASWRQCVIPRLGGREKDKSIWTLTKEDWENCKFSKRGKDGIREST